MTSAYTTDQWLDKIVKILKVADDPGTPEAAREKLYISALGLMQKHGIDQALLASKGEIRDEMIMRLTVFSNPWATQHSDLYRHIARANRCKTVRMGKVDGLLTYHVFGFQSDVSTSRELYNVILGQANLLLARAVVPSYDNAKSYRAGWWTGFNSEIGDRIRKAAKITEAETDTSTALVLVTREEQADAAMNAAFPKLTHFKVKRGGSLSGRSDGRSAARSAVINPSASFSSNRKAIG
jgi:hypothetical protein